MVFKGGVEVACSSGARADAEIVRWLQLAA